MEDGVFVTNIKATVDQASLRSFFGEFGTIAELNLQPDKFNEANKVCYLKFTSSDSAAKCVKLGDRSMHFGEPLKIALKSFKERIPLKIMENKPLENKNGINRIQSFGRGRGAVLSSPGAPAFGNEVVQLTNLELPLEKKCTVEIIELKSLTNILVRPLILTEKLRSDLYPILEKHNGNPDRLMPVRNAVVGGFYLAKWTEDNNFYRAQILKKLSDGKFEVFFVDEGTTGDIVTELRCIPDDLSDIPCQFVACTADCNDSPELIELVLKEGSDKVVSVYTISSKKVNDKYVVSIFIDDNNIIDIYKNKHSKDPRIETVPCKSDLKAYSVGQQLSNCHLTKTGKEANHVIVTLKQATPLNPSLQPLSTCAIVNDLLIYKDKGTVHRCIVEACKLEKDRMQYMVDLIDEGKQVNAVTDQLMKCSVTDLNGPPSSIRAVMDSSSCISLEAIDTVTIADYDGRKNLYEIKIIEHKKPSPVKVTSTGQSKAVVVSHVESANEFYTQLCDEVSLLSLDRIQTEINDESYKVVKVNNIRELKSGQVVLAPFESVNYRAIVKEIDVDKSRCLCFFMDFGNSEWVAANDVIKANDSVAHKDPLAQRCQLSVAVRADKVAEVTEMLLDYCGRGEIEVQMKVVESQGDVLSVNIVADKKSSFADLLQCEGLVCAATKTRAPENDPRVKEVLIKKIADLEHRIALLESMNGHK